MECNVKFQYYAAWKKHKKNKTKQNKNKQTNKQNILNLELV